MNSSTSSLNLDTLDIDQYINYDPSPILPNPSYSPKFSPTKSDLASIPASSNSNDLFTSQSSQQIFARPSHQYELHKQQTGLPIGALANTLAVNQSDHIVYGHAQRMFDASPINGYMNINTPEDTFDFNTNPSQDVGTDMDIDFGSPLYDSTAAYINPSAVGGQESSVASIPPKQRAWPGMHQQQAAMAKAQAEAQAQAQSRKAQKKPLPQQQGAPSSRLSSQRSSNNSASAKDPIVEERISRLLNQMRNSSVASSNDDAPTPTAHGGLSSLGRAKKDEEDMDEDERLLASEEGKKLSSKERRQLRNKVSARAFRSRRKEYIGQLEGELATKTTEANDLRAKNQELMAENNRLTDLTRMLLESSAFNSFLNELSNTDNQDTISSSSSQKQTPTPKIEEPPPTLPKDVNPHQPSPHAQSDHEGAQLGMALMPETYYNFNATNTAWADNMDSSLYDAQVYAVTSMPEGPAFDEYGLGLLSGKSSSSIGSFVSDEAKKDFPTIEHLPLPYEEAKAQMPLLEESTNPCANHSDRSFAHLDDASSRSIPASAQLKGTSSDTVSPEKPSIWIDMTMVEEGVKSHDIGAATMSRFLQFCAAMEGPSQRVASVTAHL
ncbi:MAG: hypothetical protein Q9170_003500 [Blastenia crenularia]